MARKKRTIIDENLPEENDLPATPPAPVVEPNSEIEAWVEGLGYDGEAPHTFYIYRVNANTKGPKAYIKKYVGQVPDLDEINRLFGPGLYDIAYTYKVKTGPNAGTWETRTKPIAIDPACQGYTGPASAGHAPATGVIDTARNGLSMVSEMFTAITPLINLIKSSVPAPVAPVQSPLDGMNGMKMMMDMQMLMMKSLTEQMMSNAKETASALREAILNQGDEKGEGDENMGGMLQQIVTMAGQFFPLLNTSQGSGAVDLVKSNPKFAELAGDPAKQVRVFEAMTKELGLEKTKVIFQKFGLPEPIIPAGVPIVEATPTSKGGKK